MDFVALHGQAGRDVGGIRQGEAFFWGHDGRHVEEAETVNAAGGAFDAVGVLNPFSEHLVAAAETQDRAALAGVGGDVDVPALGAEVGEVGDGRLGAGDQDQVGVAGQGAAGADDVHADAGVGLQGVEVVEIGDPVEAGDGDLEAGARGGGLAGEVHDVLGGQAPSVGEPWQDAQGGPAGAGGDDVHAFGKEGGVAAEFVHRKTADEGEVLGGGRRGCRRAGR